MSESFRILGLDHIVIRANDLQRLESFYCDVLGCTRERELAELGLLQLRAGGALIDLVAVDGPLGEAGGPGPGTSAHNVDHFCLRVEPFEPETMRRLQRQLGIAEQAPQRRYGADGFGPSIYIEDPEGNTVELKGPPETD